MGADRAKFTNVSQKFDSHRGRDKYTEAEAARHHGLRGSLYVAISHGKR